MLIQTPTTEIHVSASNTTCVQAARPQKCHLHSSLFLFKLDHEQFTKDIILDVFTMSRTNEFTCNPKTAAAYVMKL